MIKLRLTRVQAWALSRMAGNWADYPDVMEDQFPHPMTRTAAYRAYEKLNTALKEGRNAQVLGDHR